MNYRLPLALLATAALFLTTTRAQSEDDDDDQEFDYFAYFSRAHKSLTFGFRATQGAKVTFGNLGIIPSATPVAAFASDATANNVTRTYLNGFVGADAPRPAEINPPTDGTVVPYVDANNVPRYYTKAKEFDGQGFPVFRPDGAQILYTNGDFLAYQAGLTRSYGVATAAQITGNSLVMSQYTTTSEGGFFEGKKSLSGGIDLQVERLFSNPAKRFRFSLAAGMSINGINSKRSGTVNSTMHILRDTYTFTGAMPSTAVYPLTTPYYTQQSYLDTNNVLINAGNAYEAQPLIIVTGTAGNGPQRSEDDTGVANVTGVWEIKGAYLVVRVGPEFAATLTPNLSLSGGAGFAAAYVGTNYTATESATILNDPTLVQNTISTGAIVSETSKVLPGYYANLDANWAINERSGLFAGISLESFGTFDQTLAGRTAKIDLGGNASLRGGLNIKF